MKEEIKYNHDRDISDFKYDLDIIRKSGFNPIAVSQMYLENTFVFETEKEANNAYKILEIKEQTIDGWWYGKKDFLKEVEKYEKQSTSKVLIHWIK